MTRSIDLNSDLGEGFGPWPMGDDPAMLALVSSANIACGGHAGDPDTMRATVQAATAQGVRIGAHPGYADRLAFGRRVIPMTALQITNMVAAQVGALSGAAALIGAKVEYIKPHGALGNLAAADPGVAGAVLSAAQALALPVLAISGTVLETLARAAGHPVYAEIFADRAYLPSGQLMPRGQPGAVLHDPDEVSARLIGFLRSGLMPVAGAAPIRLIAHSVCVHGDSPGAVDMARSIRARLEAEGISLAAFLGR